MPGYKDMLTDQEIWQIVTYMRAGFPNAAKTGQN
jgi:mono/diheme cytochrome c family protein